MQHTGPLVATKHRDFTQYQTPGPPNQVNSVTDAGLGKQSHLDVMPNIPR